MVMFSVFVYYYPEAIKAMGLGRLSTKSMVIWDHGWDDIARG